MTHTVGDKAFLKKKFSSNDVVQFAEISMDKNPIHLDDIYSANTLFKKRIVHGLLVSSLISATLANKLPGDGSVYLSQNLNFKKPVYIDQEVTCVVEIAEIISEKSIYKMITNCYVNENEIAIEGTAVIKLII